MQYTNSSTIDELSTLVNGIQTLINAPKSTIDPGADSSDVEQFINSTLVPFLEQLEILPDKKQIFDELDNGLQSWKNLKRKPWLENKTVVAFMGRFSSGKSSLINGLLQEDLLAVDATETTAVPAYISWGQQPAVKYTDLEDNLRVVDPAVFKHFSKESFKGFRLSSLVRNFIVEYPVSSLKRISILDTPGYDAVAKEDRQKALEVLSESHYVFWVVDINDGDISEDSLRFIRENLRHQKLYVILSKADQKPETACKAALEQVEKTLRKKGVPFEACLLYSRRQEALKSRLAQLIFQLEVVTSRQFKETLEEIVAGAQYLVDEKIDELKKAVNEGENEKETLDNTIAALVDACGEDWGALKNRVDAMTYAMEHQFQGGLFNMIVLRYGDLIDTYNAMINAFNTTKGSYTKLLENLENVSRFGIYAALIAKAQEELTKMESNWDALFNIEEAIKQLF